MTISVDDYFKTRENDRKKETRYINVINRDSCTSCNSCATVCPVDCIYEVQGFPPTESYHQIDTSRCIGCQMCYRVPADSNDHYNMEVCPWNAIDMLHNPNVKPSDESVLFPYYQGESTDLPWPKLEEYGYQLFLDGVVYLPLDTEDLHQIFSYLQESAWYYDEGITHPIVQEEREETETYVIYRATLEGRDILDVVFDQYERIFMD